MPTLSVDAFQLSGITVSVTLPIERPLGAVGAWLSTAVGGAAGDGTTGVGIGGGCSPSPLSPGSGPAHAAVVTNSWKRPERRPFGLRARRVNRYRVAHASVEKVKRRPRTIATRRPFTYSSTRARPDFGCFHTTETLEGATPVMCTPASRGARRAAGAAAAVATRTTRTARARREKMGTVPPCTAWR